MLAALKEKMQSLGVSIEELDDFSVLLNRKVKETNLRSMQVTNNEAGIHYTQLDMNLNARAQLDVDEAKLKLALAELATFYRDREEIEKVQGAWEVYREVAADYAASEYEGGSIRPLI